MSTKQEAVLESENYVAYFDHGFVGLIDHMGSDGAICQAARTSYGKGTKTVQEDRGLIRYLMRHMHTSPFEMCEIKFHLKIPIFVMRQLVRHRTASLNEYSGRYSEMTDEMYSPVPDRIQSQSKDNKQGSGEELNLAEKSFIENFLDKSYDITYNNYQHCLSMGLSRELARIQLPVANYTELYWKIDLRNLFHFLKLRLHPHAQYEIRVLAELIYEFTKPLFPIACEAFEDYWLNSVTFSAQEMKVIHALIYGRLEEAKDNIEKLSKREQEEFNAKIGL